MDLQLRGKRALVTGSTAGIGLAAAAGLYREGASVVVNGRTPQRVEEAVSKIRDQGGEGDVEIPVEVIHYGMTKTAQLAIGRGVAESVAGTGITVNSVLPGPTESEGVATFVADLARQRGVARSVVEAEFFQTARPSSL